MKSFLVHNIFRSLILIVLLTGLSVRTADSISVREEEVLAEEFMKEFSRRAELIEDRKINTYVEEVGYRVLASFPAQPFQYRFHVVKDSDYNAFALPAGRIFVNSGLLEAMESEEELAGILSHEIAHVHCRHISQRIDRMPKINLATLAGIAAAVLLGAGGESSAANAMAIGTLAAGQTMALAYSREDEIQADRIGLKYLFKADYSGEGLLEMLRKIRNKEWYGPDQIPAYLKTHPAVEERIAYIDGQLSLSKLPERKDPERFSRIHMRLLALYGETAATRLQLETRLQKDPENSLINHGYGLFLSRTGANEKAIFHLKKALEKRIFDAQLLADLGCICLRGGRLEEALKALQSAAILTPDHPEGLFCLGRTQMGIGRYEEAISVFEKLAKIEPETRHLDHYLGESHGKLGNLESAHYHLGRDAFREKKGRVASFHLKKALSLTKDENRKTEIEKMLSIMEKRKKGEQTQDKKPQP